jgi:hypothetical protein
MTALTTVSWLFFGISCMYAAILEPKASLMALMACICCVLINLWDKDDKTPRY